MERTVLPGDFSAQPTPQQKSAHRWQQIIGTVIMLVTMIALLPLVLRSPRPSFVVPSTAVLVLSTFIFFPLALFFSVTWHELGHLLASRLVGFRFVLVTFGPLRIAREVGGLRLSLIDNNIMQWQGRALTVPPSFGSFIRERMVILAGGPAATISQLLLLLGANYLLRERTIAYGWGLALLWSLLAAVMMVPATAIPQKIGNIYTDAARLWQLWRGGEGLTNQLALANLVEASLRGVPPRELDEHFLARTLAAPPDSGEALVGHYIAHLRALDQARTEQAAKYLDATLALLLRQPPSLRSPIIFAAAASFAARYENDLATAEEWMALVQPDRYNALALEVEQALLRVRAELLQLSGELALAKTAAQQSLQMLSRSVDLGSVEMESRILNEILATAADVPAAPALPEALQPVLARRRPFFAATGRGLLRVALIIIIGLLLGFGWEQLFPGRAVTAYQQGVAHLENGEFDAAITDFNKAIALDDQFSQAYWGRGDAFMSLGMYYPALADFDQVVAMHPKTFPSIYIYRAAAFTQIGDFPAAIADYETLLSLNPDEPLRQLALDSIHLLETAE